MTSLQEKLKEFLGKTPEEQKDLILEASAGGYSSGYMGSNASSSGYAREEYAQGSGGSSGGASGGGGGGSGGAGGQVFEARTDQSRYLGP